MTNKKSTVGRKCSICTHDELEIINELIGRKSFRAISRQIQGNVSMRDAIRRHSENCNVSLATEPTLSIVESADFSDKPQTGIALFEADEVQEQQAVDSTIKTNEDTETLSQNEERKKELVEAIRQAILGQPENQSVDWLRCVNRTR